MSKLGGNIVFHSLYYKDLFSLYLRRRVKRDFLILDEIQPRMTLLTLYSAGCGILRSVYLNSKSIETVSIGKDP